ncbi:Gfo/Idh/MocA family protein [Porphyrobacter sp. GA68]|uniref:Gfo/Idh/MocA family protein n=1 Tax=Porphyrobacter sp. GA68 TaxID=2883480 RepID=UPI001D17D430|nr:Gfo/Idh/MocA family oxidoreductase [Porphyrobacter sp. GA68]
MRWGIIGYGWVARDYMAPGICAAGGTVAAVCDPSAAAREIAERDGARAYGEVSSMLEAGGLDALYIAAPNNRHEEALDGALASGLPILCEKPLAQDGAAVERIADRVAGYRAPLGVAFDQRHHPAHVAVRDRIAAGDLGMVTAVRIVYCCWVDPDWNRGTGANWRADAGCAGGGAVLDLAPHGLDLAHFLLGEPIEDIAITLQRRVHDYPVEDGGMVHGRTASGVLFSSHTSYNWPEPLPRRRLEIAGTRGLIVASDTMGQEAGGHATRIDARDGRHELLLFDTSLSPFAAQAAAFTAQVRAGSGSFSIDRDVHAARRFFAAYREAQACL